jgi:antitoxin HicB
MTMDHFYPIVVVSVAADEGGGFMGYAPDLKGCMSHGDSPEEALTSTGEAVLEWLEEAKASNLPIPLPGIGQHEGQAGPGTALQGHQRTE